MKRLFYFVSGLWYPAGLGAGIAWWIQAVATRADVSTQKPTTWALLFGLWFLLYHGTWFVSLMAAYAEAPATYSLRHFWSDLIDGAALLGAFASLGFASAQYRLLDHGWLFAFAACIPISALVANAKPSPRTWFATVLAFIDAGAGAVTQWGVVTDAHGFLDDLLLLFLYVLLGFYLSMPEWFGSSRAAAKA
jgi:hypothetical protein